MLEGFDFTAISIALIVVIGLIIGSKVILGHQQTGSKALRSKIREMEDYTEFLKKQMRTYKNKASNMEKGPDIEGDLDNLDDILPELVQEFAPYAPKWLKPFLSNSDMQKWIIEYAGKNPDKVKQMLGKMVSRKQSKNDDNQEQENAISV